MSRGYPTRRNIGEPRVRREDRREWAGHRTRRSRPTRAPPLVLPRQACEPWPVSSKVLSRPPPGNLTMSRPDARVVAIIGTTRRSVAFAKVLAAGGTKVVIGGKGAEADDIARTLRQRGLPVVGAPHTAAAGAAELAIVALSWADHANVLKLLSRELAGKVVVDSVAPLGFDAKGPYALPVLDGSATEQAAFFLPQSRVVGAFHHLSASMLDEASWDKPVDTFVFGDDDDGVEAVVSLATLIPGVRGWRAGRLRDAQQIEALTANLIAINHHHGVRPGLTINDHSAGSWLPFAAADHSAAPPSVVQPTEPSVLADEGRPTAPAFRDVLGGSDAALQEGVAS